jgi:hypothetical protein
MITPILEALTATRQRPKHALPLWLQPDLVLQQPREATAIANMLTLTAMARPHLDLQ